MGGGISQCWQGGEGIRKPCNALRYLQSHFTPFDRFKYKISVFSVLLNPDPVLAVVESESHSDRNLDQGFVTKKIFVFSKTVIYHIPGTVCLLRHLQRIFKLQEKPRAQKCIL